MSIGQLTESEIEQEIQNKKLTAAPRLTPQDIDALVMDAHYWRVPGDTMIVCALTLVNGYTVIGEAACVASENFDEEIGQKIARDKARDKIWALAGYALANEQWTIQRVEELQARDMLEADLKG